MKRPTYLTSALVVLTLLVSACGSATAGTAAKAATTPASSSSCSFPSFTAIVRHGPDAGLSIQGQLTFQVDGTGSVTGSLDSIKQIVAVHGLINSTLEFDGQATVMNGASDFLVDVFGEAGKHVRTSAGLASLPMGLAASVYSTRWVAGTESRVEPG